MAEHPSTRDVPELSIQQVSVLNTLILRSNSLREEIASYGTDIKGMYAELMSDGSSLITPEKAKLYQGIETLFTKKQALQVEFANVRREVLELTIGSSSV